MLIKAMMEATPAHCDSKTQLGFLVGVLFVSQNFPAAFKAAWTVVRGSNRDSGMSSMGTAP